MFDSWIRLTIDLLHNRRQSCSNPLIERGTDLRCYMLDPRLREVSRNTEVSLSRRKEGTIASKFKTGVVVIEFKVEWNWQQRIAVPWCCFACRWGALGFRIVSKIGLYHWEMEQGPPHYRNNHPELDTSLNMGSMLFLQLQKHRIYGLQSEKSCVRIVLWRPRCSTWSETGTRWA